ncbi:MAG: DUF4377 domain-containing protein [Granulosicoccaceae bacterium]
MMIKRWRIRFSVAMLALLAACSVSDSQNLSEGVRGDESADTLYVAPEQVDCTGVAPQRCLQVRKPSESEWSYFYDAIHGFEFEPGYYWTLEVRYTHIENPPADGSSIRVDLIRVLEQTPAGESTEDIEVSSVLTQCNTSGQDEHCLRIRPIGLQAWSTWPGGIEGYSHTAGVATQLRVKNLPWGDLPRQHDAPPFRRVLVSLLASYTS